MSTHRLNGRIIKEVECAKPSKERVRDDNIYFFWTLEKLYKYYESFKDKEDTGAGQAVQPVRENEVQQ